MRNRDRFKIEKPVKNFKSYVNQDGCYPNTNMLYYLFFQVRFWIFHPVQEKQRDRNNSDVTHVRSF